MTERERLPGNLSLTLILTDAAIRRSFADLTPQITGTEMPAEIVALLQTGGRESERALFQQEITFTHGLVGKIKEDYIRIGFLETLEQEVSSGEVFSDTIETTDEAIEARIKFFWDKMKYNTPNGLVNLAPELETNYRRLIQKGVGAGVIIGGQLIQAPLAVEMIIMMHHMIERVKFMLGLYGFDTSLFERSDDQQEE